MVNIVMIQILFTVVRTKIFSYVVPHRRVCGLTNFGNWLLFLFYVFIFIYRILTNIVRVSSRTMVLFTNVKNCFFLVTGLRSKCSINLRSEQKTNYILSLNYVSVFWQNAPLCISVWYIDIEIYPTVAGAELFWDLVTEYTIGLPKLNWTFVTSCQREAANKYRLFLNYVSSFRLKPANEWEMPGPVDSNPVVAPRTLHQRVERWNIHALGSCVNRVSPNSCWDIFLFIFNLWGKPGPGDSNLVATPPLLPKEKHLKQRHSVCNIYPRSIYTRMDVSY